MHYTSHEMHEHITHEYVRGSYSFALAGVSVRTITYLAFLLRF